MTFPKIELVSEKHQYNIFSYLYEKILFLKQRLRQSIQNNFLPPQSSILQGTILGDNGAMSQDLKNKLNVTGIKAFYCYFRLAHCNFNFNFNVFSFGNRNVAEPGILYYSNFYLHLYYFNRRFGCGRKGRNYGHNLFIGAKIWQAGI